MSPELRRVLEAAFPGEAARYFSPMSIGDTPGVADAGAAAILAGAKTATSSAHWDYPEPRSSASGLPWRGGSDRTPVTGHAAGRQARTLRQGGVPTSGGPRLDRHHRGAAAGARRALASQWPGSPTFRARRSPAPPSGGCAALPIGGGLPFPPDRAVSQADQPMH
jgi:hypothetical protein